MQSGTEKVADEVISWFRAHARPLPWREPTSPWGILVAEVMSQQTPVARVEPIWREWLHRWPTPADLAAAPTAEVLRAWQGLGYPRRALRLKECAGVLQERYVGEVPRDYDQLVELPGVGDYTAAAVLTFAFADRVVLLDTNIRRVLVRAWLGYQFPHDVTEKTLRTLAAELLPPEPAAAWWNAALMELGALVCTARTPNCPACPLQDHCQWARAGYPASAKKSRTQAWAGTDRYVRGQIMGALRAAADPLPVPVIQWADAEQLQRALESLQTDGLIMLVDSPAGPLAALPT